MVPCTFRNGTGPVMVSTTRNGWSLTQELCLNFQIFRWPCIETKCGSRWLLGPCSLKHHFLYREKPMATASSSAASSSAAPSSSELRRYEHVVSRAPSASSSASSSTTGGASSAVSATTGSTEPAPPRATGLQTRSPNVKNIKTTTATSEISKTSAASKPSSSVATQRTTTAAVRNHCLLP